jgi:hypothetical protein
MQSAKSVGLWNPHAGVQLCTTPQRYPECPLARPAPPTVPSVASTILRLRSRRTFVNVGMALLSQSRNSLDPFGVVRVGETVGGCVMSAANHLRHTTPHQSITHRLECRYHSVGRQGLIRLRLVWRWALECWRSGNEINIVISRIIGTLNYRLIGGGAGAWDCGSGRRLWPSRGPALWSTSTWSARPTMCVGRSGSLAPKLAINS